MTRKADLRHETAQPACVGCRWFRVYKPPGLPGQVLDGSRGQCFRWAPGIIYNLSVPACEGAGWARPETKSSDFCGQFNPVEA